MKHSVLVHSQRRAVLRAALYESQRQIGPPLRQLHGPARGDVPLTELDRWDERLALRNEAHVLDSLASHHDDLTLGVIEVGRRSGAPKLKEDERDAQAALVR